MSRLKQITDNHMQLLELEGLVRHYGLSAEFVATALLEQCNQQLGEEGGDQQKGKQGQQKDKNQDQQQNKQGKDSGQQDDSCEELSPEDKQAMQDFIEDLEQFCAKL
ncbi:hypothetical protein [Marinicrinis sediminis]|uniref:Uncharacterized protein n=1 Tax=Marinicrinis sediminis TaxID=1652465 RepID=A0ABW5R696_9BACL